MPKLLSYTLIILLRNGMLNLHLKYKFGILLTYKGFWHMSNGKLQCIYDQQVYFLMLIYYTIWFTKGHTRLNSICKINK
jgi:hypothetical protein